MFRKIPSKLQPGITLGSELKKEFAGFFISFQNSAVKLLQRRAKFVYAVMVAMLIASLVLSLAVFTPEERVSAEKKSASVVSPVSEGFSEILQQGEALRKAIALKRDIEEMLSKDSLSHTDSLELASSIDELHRLSEYQPLKPSPK